MPRADLGIVIPTYVFATPVLGGQAAVGVIGIVWPRQHLAGGDACGHVDDADSARVPFLALRQHQRLGAGVSATCSR